MLLFTRPCTEESAWDTFVKSSLNVCKAVMRPVVTFGAESWAVTNKTWRLDDVRKENLVKSSYVGQRMKLVTGE